MPAENERRITGEAAGVTGYAAIRADLLADPGLGDAECRLLAWLAARPPGELIDAGKAAAELGRAPSWAARALTGLRRRGLIETRQVRTPGGRRIARWECWLAAGVAAPVPGGEPQAAPTGPDPAEYTVPTPPESAEKTARRRALDLAAAKLHAAHVAACAPPLPRCDVRAQGEYIAELIVRGGHDPAVVAAALAAWRGRRAAGERVSRRTLDWILEDLELPPARPAGRRAAHQPYQREPDMAAYAARF